MVMFNSYVNVYQMVHPSMIYPPNGWCFRHKKSRSPHAPSETPVMYTNSHTLCINVDIPQLEASWSCFTRVIQGDLDQKSDKWRFPFRHWTPTQSSLLVAVSLANQPSYHLGVPPI